MIAPAGSRIVLVGGSSHHRGGLETFCERATAALSAAGAAVVPIAAETAYLDRRRLGAVAGAIRRLARARGAGTIAWVQVSNLADHAFILAARALGMRVIATPHYGARSRLVTHGAAGRIARAMMARADAVGLLFADQPAEIALPAGPRRFVLGTFLSDHNLADPPRRRDGPLHLVHAGRLSEAKGSLRMVALCAALNRRGVPFSATIAGSGDAATMAQIHAEIAAAGIGERVHLVGWLGDAAMSAALDRADVLVHLSAIDSYPLIVLEAMARGAVPIVIDMAGAAAMTRDHGGLALPAEAAADQAADWLAAQPVAVIRDRGAAIGASVRAAFAWERIAGRLLGAIAA